MERKHNFLMFISFIAFYIILFSERVTSLVMSYLDESIGLRKMFFGGAFNKFAYGMTILALLVSFVLFLRIVGKAMSYGIGGSSTLLILNSGALLIAGMQDIQPRAEFIIIQFIAYIFLFIACLTKFIEIRQKKDALGSTIASFIYFVGFGMAIPIVHSTTVTGHPAKVYYMFEAIASCGIALAFMIMMFFIFSEERYRHANNVAFFAVLVGLDALVLVQGFGIGDPNLFMAGALAVAVIAYLVTVILLFRDKKAKLL